jgi:wyosine [tRNA(Phe)-imidazoG37] synthetase (radical SAM superfamily)
LKNEKLPQDPQPSKLFQSHPRQYESNRYVYPVLSRRARGVSIGINLSLDFTCNFDCIYCQVPRKQNQPSADREIFLPQLETELTQTLQLVTSGKIFESPPFSDIPPELRRFNDIALSGDGEPTISPHFVEVLKLCANLLKQNQLNTDEDPIKIVLITNSTLLHLDRVKQGLEVMDANNGEIWAKLDAGTESYYQAVCRSKVPFEQILKNLTETAQKRPIVIQTLFMRIRDEVPSEEEIEAYCRRLAEIVEAGGQIKHIQLHTIARAPTEVWAESLEKSKLEQIAQTVRKKTAIDIEVF